MAENLYGEEWDSDEFQTALKVVLKCEIQSLLERLSETGEETVLLTASAVDHCVGHLASSKALRFVNTNDVGVVKNKFLSFLTGKVSQISNVICNSLTPKGPGAQPKPDTLGKSANAKTVTPNQARPGEKRPLETTSVSQDVSSQSLDLKRRKTDSQVPVGKGTIMTSVQSAPVSSALLTQATAPNTNKGPAPKLKTTKVVSKSGGFTEERFSNAEFQKFLAQYKPNQPVGDDEDDSNSKDTAAFLRSVSQSQASQQKPFQPSPVSSVHNTQNKVTTAVNNSSTDKNVKNLNQSVKTQSNQKWVEPKKDAGSAKLDNKSVNKENRENVNTANLGEMEMVTEIKEELDPDDLEFKDSQSSGKKDSEQNVSIEKDKAGPIAGTTQKKETTGQSDKPGVSAQNKNRLESIDNMDTETLIQMTKAKHWENMSEADREIQAKLGQLSSKLSWVVEYPKEKGKGESAGQSVSGVKPQVTMAGSAPLVAGAVHPGVYHDNADDDELDEMDDEDFLDDDEFDDEGLDDEDKATLKAMRIAKLMKLDDDDEEEGVMFPEGYAVSQQFHTQQFPEDYEEEDEDYEDYEELHTEENFTVNVGHLRDNRIHGMLPALSGPNMAHGHGEGPPVPISQPYQRASSPTSENFLMIGPIMAKCLICNKIVRKTEMKPHHETHLNEEGFDDEEEEEEDLGDIDEDENSRGTFHEQKALQGEYRQEEGEYPPEEGEYMEEEGDYPAEEGDYSEDYEFQGEETEESMEFTAETFVAEKLVAEKLDMSESSQEGKDNVCDICHKSFKSHSNMIRHRKNIHKNQADTSCKGSKDDSVHSPCPVCGKTFRYVQKHLKNKHPEYQSESVSGEACEDPSEGLKCNTSGEQFTDEGK